MTATSKALLLILGSALTVFAQGPFSPCDVNQDGFINVADVKYIVNEVLGVIPAAHDINQDGAVNALDVQVIIEAARGYGCRAVAVTLVNPNTGLQGQQNESVSVTGLQTHWVQGTATASLGASDDGEPKTISFASPLRSFSGDFTYGVPLTIEALNASDKPIASAVTAFPNNEALSGPRRR